MQILNGTKKTAKSFDTSLVKELETNTIYDKFPILENADITKLRDTDSGIYIYSR